MPKFSARFYTMVILRNYYKKVKIVLCHIFTTQAGTDLP
jgi:hypothetical protein